MDSFGGIVKEDGTRLAPKEWMGEAFEILEPGERRPEYPVAALRSESGLLEEGAVGRGLDAFTDTELTAELKRRGYAGTVSKVIRIDAC